MAIYRNGELSRNKEKAPEPVNVGTLLFDSDAHLNKDLLDYITQCVKAQTSLEIIKNVCHTDSVDETSALALINAILGG